MEIKIIGDHLEVTEPISEYVKKKFNSLIIPDKLTQVEFRIGLENKVEQYIQFNAHVEHKDLNIRVKNENLYHGIDSLMDKVNRSFIKLKEKNHIHTHRVHSSLRI